MLSKAEQNEINSQMLAEPEHQTEAQKRKRGRCFPEEKTG